MVKAGKNYLIMPTIVKMWKPSRGISRYYVRSLKPVYYKATLISILKKCFVFGVDDLGGHWKMPFCAVEVHNLVNKPFNIESLRELAKRNIEKFSEHGFSEMTTTDLRSILAILYLKKRSADDTALNVATGVEKLYLDRGNVIRALRNTFRFRDTKENRELQRKNLSEGDYDY